MFLRVPRILIAILLLFVGSANALKIEINKGQVQPDPIAIVDFYDDKGSDSKKGTEICKIIKKDLELSGLFLPLDDSVFLEKKADLFNKGPNIKNWSVLNTRFLVYGSVAEGFSGFVVKFDLVDVVTGANMLSITVEGTDAKLRKVAHVIADYIYERITNEKGYFNTNIVYVETANKISTKRKTRLIKIDQDGFNPRQLTDGSELVSTPRYSSDGKSLAYISYSDVAKDVLGKSAYVYMMDADSGSKRLMISKDLMKTLIKKNHGNPVQMTFAPRFSPDNQSAVLAIIIDGKSAIYTINFASNELKQLTQTDSATLANWHATDGSVVDTSPCYSDDGKKIVFTSNRAVQEAIYTMNVDGSDQKKISTGTGRYSQPVWSPRGDLIAYTKRSNGTFCIGVMRTDGSGERLITSGYLVEAPCWSSNGRYITYSTEGGHGSKSAIAVVDITGNFKRLIETKGDAWYPAWSPTLNVTKK